MEPNEDQKARIEEFKKGLAELSARTRIELNPSINLVDTTPEEVPVGKAELTND